MKNGNEHYLQTTIKIPALNQKIIKIFKVLSSFRLTASSNLTHEFHHFQ